MLQQGRRQTTNIVTRCTDRCRCVYKIRSEIRRDNKNEIRGDRAINEQKHGTDGHFSANENVINILLLSLADDTDFKETCHVQEILQNSKFNKQNYILATDCKDTDICDALTKRKCSINISDSDYSSFWSKHFKLESNDDTDSAGQDKREGCSLNIIKIKDSPTSEVHVPVDQPETSSFGLVSF